MTDAGSPVREGEVLAGKYVVEKVLGVGGMGVVVRAHHTQLDQRVALKFLLPEAMGRPEAVARFAREARAAVKIKGEHVARVIDVGTLDGGAPYMVMEYLDGSDLEAVLRARGPLPVEEAVEYVLQACEAIAEAHALGIVHRDLKPANLYLVRRPDGSPSVKVLDFGISKSIQGGSGDAGLTRTAAVMGSPLYMSPEQLASAKDVDGRTDIWALGVILHQLVTGDVPFNGETLPELCLKIVQAPPAPLRSLRPELPVALEAIVSRCLEKERAQRPADVAELAMALSEVAPPRARANAERAFKILRGADAPAGGPLPSPANVEAVARAAETGASWGQTAYEPPKRSARWVWIIAAVVPVFALALFVAARSGSGATASPSVAEAAAPAPTASSSASPVALPKSEPEPTASPTPSAEPATVESARPRAAQVGKAAPLLPPDKKVAAPSKSADPAPAQKPAPVTTSTSSIGGRL